MDGRIVRVLLIEHDAKDAARICKKLTEFARVRFQVSVAERLPVALDRLNSGRVDVVLLDLPSREGDGLAMLDNIKARAPDVPVVVVANNSDPELPVTAVRRGAQNFLFKEELTASSLARALRYPIERVHRKAVEKIVEGTDEELRAAQKIQQRLFPSQAPEVPGIDIGGVGYPAQATGGDYFDYIVHSNGLVDIAIGDVSGHGFGPALLMAETRAYLRAFARGHGDVREILRLLNEVLLEDTEEDRYVTLFLARLDPQSRSLVYANAGHPSAYVLDADGAVRQILSSTAAPVGAFPDVEFAASATVLEPGQIVLLTTDGVTDARSSHDRAFGIERALDVVRASRHRSSGEIARVLCRTVRDYCREDPHRDDITAIVIKVAA